MQGENVGADLLNGGARLQRLGIDRVLQAVEVAGIFPGDLRGVIAAGHAVEHQRNFLHRPKSRVQRGINAFDHLAELAAMLAGIGPGGELAADGGIRQHLGIGDQSGDRLHHGDEGGHELVLLGAAAQAHEFFQLVIEVADRHQLQHANGIQAAHFQLLGGTAEFGEDAGIIAFEGKRVVVDGHALEHLIDLYQAVQRGDRGVEVVHQQVEIAGIDGGDSGGTSPRLMVATVSAATLRGAVTASKAALTLCMTLPYSP